MNMENANREQLLNALYNARGPLLQINNLQAQINENEKLMDDNAHGISLIRIIKAALIAFGMFILSIIIVGFSLKFVDDSVSQYTDFLPFLVFPIVFIIFLKKWKKQRLKANENILAENDILKKQMSDIIVNNREILSWIPNKYCNYYTVREFIQILENYRANSLKELANVYEQDVFSKRILQSQEEIKAQQMNIAIISAVQQSYNTRKITDAINYGIDYKI
ncbi:MAG: hypothetical protein ACI4IR_01300 [Eubacterium sp.]